MKPASPRNAAIGCCDGVVPSISSISMPRGASPPLRARSMSTCATARATFDRSGSASGKNVSSTRSPRARNAASAPFTMITVAPTDRVGPRPASSPFGEAVHFSVAPYGLAGSVADNTAISISSGASRIERSRSRAPGSANCVAPRPATKYPRRIRPFSSKPFSTGYTVPNPPGIASAAIASRVTTPCRTSSCCVTAAAHLVVWGSGVRFRSERDSRPLGTSVQRPSADGGASRRERNDAASCGRAAFMRRRGACARVNARRRSFAAGA